MLLTPPREKPWGLLDKLCSEVLPRGAEDEARAEIMPETYSEMLSAFNAAFPPRLPIRILV